MLHFLEKKDKSSKRWGLRSQTPGWPPAAGALPSDAQVATFVTCFNYFKITAYCLILE